MTVSNLFDIKGKVVVFTGASGVLGSRLCKMLSQANAKVVLIGRRQEALDSLAAEIQAEDGIALPISCDVLSKQQVSSACDLVVKKFGRVDILVNAAGGNMPGATIPPDKTFFDLTIDDFDQVVRLNLTGTVLPSQIFGAVMANQKEGVIINISSMTAIRPLTRVVGYGAAKAAVSNFTQWLAVEMAKKIGEHVRVNAIAPGFFITEQNRKLLTKADGSLTDRGNSIIRNTPYGRFGEAEELGGTLIWLCSDASRFVTGIVVPVDGGFSAYAGV